MRLMKSYIRKSVAAKIILLFVALLIPLFFVAIWSASKSANSILLADRKSAEKKIAFLGAKSLDNYFSQIDTFLLSPYLSKGFIINLGSKTMDYYGTVQNESTLKSLLFSHPEFEYLYFYNLQSGILLSFSKQTSSYNLLPGWKEIAWISEPLENRDGFALGPPGIFTNYFSIGTLFSDSVFMASRKIFDIETGRNLAVLGLAISSERLLEILENIYTGREFMGLYMGSQTLFETSGLEAYEQSFLQEAREQESGEIHQVVQFTKTYDSGQYLVTSILINHDIRLVKAVPFSDIQSSTKKSTRINLIFLGILTLVLALAFSFILYRMLAPLHDLSFGMRKVGSGNWDLPPIKVYRENRQDEIGVLISIFHTMVEDLNSLIQREYTAKIRIQEARLAALESQINPHFLFNTFQSIGSLALETGAETIYEMNLALAGIMRYALKKGEESATLGDELCYLRQYLKIQKMRFGEKLSVHWEVDETLYEEQMPKLIFQPIAENAIVHNLEISRKPLLLKITASHRDDGFEVQIEDNGRGISNEGLLELNRFIKQPDSPDRRETHIGIRNVVQRLVLVFQDRAEIFFERGKEGGLLFRVVIKSD